MTLSWKLCQYFGDEDVMQDEMILKRELIKPQQNLLSTKCKDIYSGTNGPDSENPEKVRTLFHGIWIAPNLGDKNVCTRLGLLTGNTRGGGMLQALPLHSIPEPHHQ